MRRAAIALSICASAIGAALGIAYAAGGRDFVIQHITPIAGAALVAVALGTVVWRLVDGAVRGAVLAVRRPKQLGQSGAAMAEFVIVIIPFMLMLTALMQLSLASMARVLVSYSAFCAARAAAVFVPMQPQETPSVSGKLGQAIEDEMANKVGYGANARTDFAISKKASLMRNAAAYPLIATSPSVDVLVSDIMNNWVPYLEGRLLKGLNPLDYLNSFFKDLTNIPAAVLDSLADQLKDAVKGGLDSPAAKQAAKQKIDSWIDSQVSDPGMRQQLKNAANGYIDKYKGSAESPTGQLGDKVKEIVTGTLGGPLEKFKDQIEQSVQSALGGVGGGGFKGYQVDRALDVGFGAGTDGAGGAILRSLRKLIYARMATVVTLHDANGNFKTKFEWNEPIRARVTHLFYCQIPLANRFAGRPFYDLNSNTVQDLATGPMKGFEIIGIPGYFLPITADHVMINQGKPL